VEGEKEKGDSESDLNGVLAREVKGGEVPSIFKNAIKEGADREQKNVRS